MIIFFLIPFRGFIHSLKHLSLFLTVRSIITSQITLLLAVVLPRRTAAWRFRSVFLRELLWRVDCTSPFSASPCLAQAGLAQPGPQLPSCAPPCQGLLTWPRHFSSLWCLLCLFSFVLVRSRAGCLALCCSAGCISLVVCFLRYSFFPPFKCVCLFVCFSCYVSSVFVFEVPGIVFHV